MKKTLWCLPLAVCLLALAPAPDAPFDLLITGGRVVDGSGAPWFAADVGVRDGKIAAVGVLAGRPAKRTIDAKGLIVAPGFIDLLGQSEYNVLVDKRAASKITQGITTEVTGEGESIAPLERAHARREEGRLSRSTAIRPTSARSAATSRPWRSAAARSTSAPSSGPAECAPSSSGRRTAGPLRRSSRA